MACLCICGQSERLQLLDARGEAEGVLCGVEGQKAELLQDNHRMAELLAGSEGDRKDIVSLLDRVMEERKDFQRQCKRFKEKGMSKHSSCSNRSKKYMYFYIFRGNSSLPNISAGVTGFYYTLIFL